MTTPPPAETSGSCRQCGTCCRRGGPALHGPDRRLIEDGLLRPANLVTIRRGELVLHPLHSAPMVVEQEFLKLQGQGPDWCCSLYDRTTATCTIYSHRPLACRLLECWNPDPLLAITGRDLLDRFAVIGPDNPLLPLVREHERLCPCPSLDSLDNRLRDQAETGNRSAILEELAGMVNLDLQYRGRVAARFGLSLADELFYFGRPLVHLLRPLGIGSREQDGKIFLFRSGASP